ncbi:Ada metal-binding domain-containing protein [Pediococcus siamensis]|uniref:Ada metal-binding domain-containing protein n=1 Tax=Pediococcus siamensis TaxID=381829 RepID=UPI0039A01BD3
MTARKRPTNGQWQAIIHNEGCADGTFFYAVLTTGIFCKPSCVSRQPRKQNVVVFPNPNAALQAGFRPCKRCQPLDTKTAFDQPIQASQRFMQKHYAQPLTVAQVAAAVHLNTSYFEHRFRKQTGQSVMRYLLDVRMAHSRDLVSEAELSIQTIARRVGFQSGNYFGRVFKAYFGVTPSNWQQQGKWGEQKWMEN